MGKRAAGPEHLTTTIKSYIIRLRQDEEGADIVMTRRFIYTEPFRRCWKAMGLDDDSLIQLETVLLRNPQLGDVIEGTGGARKMRIRLEGRGKRGGGRIIYLDVLEHEDLYLLFAYPKNVQDDLTPDQKKAIRTMVEMIRKG